MRKMVSDALTKGGHEVVGEAGNGVEAVARFQELKPELTTLDITMPEKDGLAALKEIIELDPSARVIMCSALGQESKVLESIKLGARIIAAADTYDVMTSRDSYRRPVSSEAALAELRRVSGTQLDPRVVDAFEAMILEGAIAFSHADETDFESELDTRSIKHRPTGADHQGELHSLAPRGNAVAEAS
jgi:two-component system chemotaxis response regulator CheY